VPSERLEIPCGDIKLEGLIDFPQDRSGPCPAVVVCHPHPLMGGDMFNDVVGTVCEALLARGFAALRFNFRGAGGSGGEHAGGYGEREDVWAALDHLRGRADIDRTRLGLAGYSFGAAVVLNAGIAAGVKALAAVSVPPRLVDFTALQGYEIPVLLIAGDRDQYAPSQSIQQLAIATGPLTTCTIVPGADHFWYGRASDLAEAVSDFFAGCLVVQSAER